MGSYLIQRTQNRIKELESHLEFLHTIQDGGTSVAAKKNLTRDSILINQMLLKVLFEQS